MASGVCYHHPTKQAVATCTGCGKGICKDCYDVYGVTSGEHAGEALCFDCTEQLVAANVKAVNMLKQKTKLELIFIGIGMVIGVIIGVANNADGGTVVFLGLVGGSAWMAISGVGNFISGCMALGMGGVGGLVPAFMGLFKILIAPIRTAIKVITRVHQINQANQIMASDSQALQEMRDYFTYTQTMQNKRGVDLAKLAAQGSELYNNTYARAVLDKGEQTAQAELRQSVVTISANGEIIRNFDPPKNKPVKKAA